MSDTSQLPLKRPLSNKLLMGLLAILLLLIVWLLIEAFGKREERAVAAFEAGRTFYIDIITGEVRGNPAKGKKRETREERLQRQLKKMGADASDIPPVVRPDAARIKKNIEQKQKQEIKRSALKVNERPLVSPLIEAPVDALQETLSGGVTLPRISDDSELEPWRSYSKPYSLNEGKAMLSIVVTNLGLNSAVTQKALTLDEYVTLAFSPYGDALHDQMNIARLSGFETWMMLPLQHETYPVHDYGPLTLLNEETDAENIELLYKIMSHGSGYAGLVSTADEKFSRSKTMEKILGEILRRGTAFATYNNTLVSPSAPLVVRAERHIAPQDLPESLDALYRDLEQYTQANGNAVITIAPMPAVIDSLNEWIKTLPKKNITLVPLTAHIKESQQE